LRRDEWKTTDYSEEMMHSTFDIDMPHYANAIVGADEIMGAIELIADPAAKAVERIAQV
jgi:hypothetical protein